MSEENVRIARQAHEAYERGGLEAAAAFIHPDFEMEQLQHHPESGTYRGGEAAARSIQDWQGSFDEFWATAEEFIDAGDRVVAVIHERGRARGGSAEIDHAYGLVFTIRDGKVARLQWFDSKADALRAVEEAPAPEIRRARS